MISGIIASSVVSIISIFLSSLTPRNLIGSSVFALLLGIVFSRFLNKSKYIEGTRFISKYILKLSIILMGGNFKF